MELKKLDVPTSSITDVKKSPMDVFGQARKAGTGVYVFNREKVAGIMLTQEQYEELLEELSEFRDKQYKPVEKENQVPEELEELAIALRKVLVKGANLSVKYLDEWMVQAGFITKKTGFGGVTELLRELSETGKIIYQLRRRENNKVIYAEIFGEAYESHRSSDMITIGQVNLIER
ncbi:type II toxin-antitoxin system Phd/YefM family antitoxin [Enterococcus alishanensis]|uniref:Type II toxin-antitoxin system Phd/YefM family antitoxin n=1 Tax=Enterococcus alishanensis TaxID=1303817 RepID=A0ABS6T8T9_9ENTE|nr:type II toxin-antitoxin system Phd/YefM family antitoxin [Enterococcus alishanensis]MBV7389313.1 type II toxin-antitoxin system Phd/YefM family antitoxin [Enterococcus alishanensis]